MIAINDTFAEFVNVYIVKINNISKEGITQTTPIPQGAANLAFFACLAIIAVGIFGNTLTILALATSGSRIKTQVTTKFVVNLAVTDLVFSLLILPLTASRYYRQSWPFGSALCQFYAFAFYSNFATSLLTITCITINRFVLITFNHLYNKVFRSFYVYGMIAFCWLFPIVILVFPLFGLWGELGLKEETFSCTILKDGMGRSPKRFLFVMGFLIPAVIIVVCYAWILVRVKRQSKQSKSTSNRDIRLTWLIFAIFAAFVVCIAPLFVANVFLSESDHAYLHVTASILAWCNAAVNPLLYFAMNAQYRNAFKKILCKKLATMSIGSSGAGRMESVNSI